MTNREAQASRILKVLQDANGKWVPLWQIQKPFEGSGIASHTRRISDLREQGHDVENRKEWVDGQAHSFYRLVQSAPIKRPVRLDVVQGQRGVTQEVLEL